MMTRIFDDPAAFANEALDGFVAAHRNHVARVDGGVVRSTGTPARHVALVVGGGSGHYPAFAGLVGAGLAAGAACGNMFASPAAVQVYRVVKAAQVGGGVLLSYGNYAGDVLNFGQAEQRLNAEGIDTRTVLVTDDVASAPLAEVAKRRGIAGDLTVFKVTTCATRSPGPPSPTWRPWPEPGGPSRKPSQPRKAKPAWTTTGSGNTPAGTGTSPSPCWPTRS